MTTSSNEPREFMPLKMVSKTDAMKGIMDFSPRPVPSDTPEEVVQPDPKDLSAQASALSSVQTADPADKSSTTDSQNGQSPEDLKKTKASPSLSVPPAPTAPAVKVST